MAQIEDSIRIILEEKNAPQHKSATSDLKEETSALQGSKEAIDDVVKAKKEDEKANKGVNSSLLTTISTIKIFSETVQHVFNKVKNLVEQQSNYAENLNLMQNAFKDTNVVALDYIDTLGELYGFDESSLTKSLGLFRQLADAMGLTSKTADQLSYNLESMALDISSLYNVSVERSANALQSALTGNIKSIRSLTGADITQATLQQKALALGIDESVRAMSRAEKAMLIYLTLADQLSNAQGDMTRTINGTANQLKIFKDQCAELARNIGGLLLPIFRQLLYYLNGILMAINEVIGAILSMFGIQATSLAEEFGVATSDLSDIFDEIGESASTSTAKIQKSLRSFDKLNNLSSQKGGGGASGISAGDVGVLQKLQDLMTEYNGHLGEVENKAKKIRDHILDWLGFSKDVNGQWKWSATDMLKNIWNWWKDLNLVGKEFVGIGVAVAVSKLLTTLKNLGTFLANTKIGTWLYTIVGSLGEKGLTGTINDLFKVYPKLSKIFGTLGGAIAVVDGLVGIANAFKAIAEGTAEVGDYLDILWNFLEVISGIAIIYGTLTTNATAVTVGIAGMALALGGKYLTNLAEASSLTKQYADFLDKVNQEQTEFLNESDTREAKVRNLYDGLTQLYDATGKLTGSYDSAKGKLALLNEELDTEYELAKDGTIEYKGKKVALQELGKQVDNYCEKLKKEAYVEAFRKSYNKLIEEEIDLYKEKNKRLEELRKSQEGYNMLDEKEAKDWLRNNEDKIRKLNELDGVIEANRKNQGSYTEAIGKAMSGQFEEATKLISNLSETESVTLDKTVKGVISGSNEMSNAVLDNLHKLDGKKAQLTIEAILDTTKADKKLKQYEKQLKQFQTGDINISSGGYSLGGIPKKADGGFLNQGDIFIANEKGAEMVGSIGHRTAVANNDQIVESISIGVAKANMATKSSQPVIIEAKGDASGLLDFITFKQKEKNRQYGI